MNPRNRNMGRRRRLLNNDSESEDFEIVPSPANFIPEDPGSEYTVGDGGPRLTQHASDISIVFQTVLIICAGVAIGVCLLSSIATNMETRIKEKNKPANIFPPVNPNAHLKLTQQFNEINHEQTLLKAQLLELIRWRESQPRELQIAVENALEQYDADKIGQIDFALGTAGGYVTSTPNTVPYEINENRLIGFIHVKERSNPQALLQPGLLPGQCFAFEGNRGRVRISLTRKIMVTRVTLEHVARNLVDDDGWSAPKEFQVIGLMGEKDQNGKVLGTFMYHIDGKSLQTFEVPNPAANPSYEHVELRVLSNYGHNEYTCVYRFRVHGVPEQ